MKISTNRSGVVEIDEFAVFFASLGNNVDIVVHYDNNPFWFLLTPIKMTLNARFILSAISG